MGSTPTPAAAPDTGELAKQQAKSNTKTAKTQQQLNMVDQYTPQGSLQYQQTGTWEDGTPKYSATQSYSPEQQKLYELGNQTGQTLGEIGVNQSSRIKDVLSDPYQSTAATENKIAQMQRGFLDPQWADQQRTMEAQLINKGVRPGTAAYDRQMQNFSSNKDRAYNQMYLDAYKTAEGSALQERNQPINEITALLSGSQVSNPAYQSTPTAGVAPVDLTGMSQMSLNQQNLGTNYQQQQNMGLMSGLFSLGGTALKGGMGGWG